MCAVGFGINDCLVRALMLLAGDSACFAAAFVLDLVLLAGACGMWSGAESIRCLRLIVGFVVTGNCAVVGTTFVAILSAVMDRVICRGVCGFTVHPRSWLRRG